VDNVTVLLRLCLLLLQYVDSSGGCFGFAMVLCAAKRRFSSSNSDEEQKRGRSEEYVRVVM
jgi:hypothetical protein